ncbi:molybdopterin-dependent oxidoreductase [Methylocaldum sp.]|uniref:molybdopterin-dependent oxidoreductase n=1 Tax=Methylocaldum sp. TaxID=1969727 RepID=UPI002D4E8686|nr:molybdopterin-dependent oxidoreductase [Methylocaldum sp.]HYE35199.1 molybdopterin-dependent oxidoreductase [Methylocaldum sp.]
MLNRRTFLKGVVGGFAVTGPGLLVPRSLRAGELPIGATEGAVLAALSGKKPLIKRTYRPPNFETPVRAFSDVITPNDQFFVRWHLANIPQVVAETWRLKVGGDSVEHPFELNLDQLKRSFEPVELFAVCQCAGNRRGFSDPHVPGIQWRAGAMGNARWKGARLKDVLARAGLKADALEIVFDGADYGAIDKTPDFIKSLPLWKALDENTLVAYEMNGEALPHWNGFPVRLVVPGWEGTYWMKQLISISAMPKPEKGFWMSTAYRIPKGKFPLIDRFLSQEGEANTPITEILVNSLMTNVEEGQHLRAGKPTTIEGLAWDGGYGIRTVEVSVDGGRAWQEAQLEKDYGRFSFRAWRHTLTPHQGGKYVLMTKATNRQGSTQPYEFIFNPAGYRNNVVQRITVEVA